MTNHNELLERLEAVESSGSPNNEGDKSWHDTANCTTNWHRNPDGPEAAQAIRRLTDEIDALREALEEARKPRFGEKGYKPPPARTHDYAPNPEYPWFCKVCGYAEHEPLQHRTERQKG